MVIELAVWNVGANCCLQEKCHLLSHRLWNQCFSFTRKVIPADLFWRNIFCVFLNNMLHMLNHSVRLKLQHTISPLKCSEVYFLALLERPLFLFISTCYLLLLCKGKNSNKGRVNIDELVSWQASPLLKLDLVLDAEALEVLFDFFR